jgi:hypothetical protein
MESRMLDAFPMSDKEILLKLNSFEDAFVERKTWSDSRDWLKTAVAFANSVPVGYPGIMFVGARNDGTIEDVGDLDSLQKSLANKLGDAYPPIYYWSKVLESGGRQLLAVVVPGSEKRPHFAGHAYIREGSQTKVASLEQFEYLLAQRNSKVYEILKWKDKMVLVRFPPVHFSSPLTERGIPFVPTAERVVIACNQFYVTLGREEPSRRDLRSYPLESIEIAFDHKNDRLELIVGRT